MKIDVKVTEQSDAWVATVEVDMETVHSVAAPSKIGALAALAALCEADLDEMAAIHMAVRSTFVDAGREQQKREALDVFAAFNDDKRGN
jgi:hypothetical protein